MRIKNFQIISKGALAAMLLLSACQKMNRPGLGNYPKDTNPPGGALKFYVAFDGTTTNPLMNAVDSIRANFASDNPLASIAGVNGKAVQGENKKFIKYAKPNDWADLSRSFTISAWFKRNGQTKNNTGTNGPEYIMSFKASTGHWSGSSLLVFLEGDNAAGQVKVMVADKTGDNWFTWENSNASTIPGLLDNNWHHMVLTYNSSNSTMTLYIDGVANSKTRTWGTHGAVVFDAEKITEVRIGAGPGTGYDTDDWLSSTFKGGIDQVRMYSTVLTQAEITALFTGKQ
ncbi:concanavalin A-like lectin/glucanase superfamily protein [Lacibacter cauensis]|uniref:Concanavalin A-like lectin/glucanase superfamily protein n=1 Tax=Lacibacter cauensis TaxID=510947 RepID=A0A562SGI0_9BACT|nr:LamG domain-containing protein [Lacibacter cauensis]TWI80308.1 concanavalin A-like lectin/glucanase superfamily protein [Lacibacter cauensis]